MELQELDLLCYCIVSLGVQYLLSLHLKYTQSCLFNAANMLLAAFLQHSGSDYKPYTVAWCRCWWRKAFCHDKDKMT